MPLHAKHAPSNVKKAQCQEWPSSIVTSLNRMYTTNLSDNCYIADPIQCEVPHSNRSKLKRKFTGKDQRAGLKIDCLNNTAIDVFEFVCSDDDSTGESREPVPAVFCVKDTYDEEAASPYQDKGST